MICFKICAAEGRKLTCANCGCCEHLCKGHQQRLIRALPESVEREIERLAATERLVDRRKPSV